ncbi:universal stress protein [Desulfopila sp. IMCC35006]|uniref:universal stress protein n=1 Tax=Desulfopila sp. IMCC35006 TaxID=2569542 RepID=UPI0010AC7B0A|nr:universal stress protein [Desulfopila sp. IMCC35006]TKB28529.1 universal stress protein [Desulfopila sp. IMCC35006]
MEKILVAINSRHGAWEALSHACSLAKRIDATLNVLLVVPLNRGRISCHAQEVEEAIRKKLELLIEAAKAEGVQINYFITEGEYAQEVISFVNNNKISLLIHEADDKKARSADKELVFVRSLRHKISCTVEIVFTKKNTAKNERIT